VSHFNGEAASRCPAKILFFRFAEIADFLAPSRLGKRGVCAIVTKREAGCDGRGSVSVQVFARTTDPDADGEVVWSWHPDADAK
jgi:hypothetical protein